MFMGTSAKQQRVHQQWQQPAPRQRTPRAQGHGNRYPLAAPYDPGGPAGTRYTDGR